MTTLVKKALDNKVVIGHFDCALPYSRRKRYCVSFSSAMATQILHKEFYCNTLELLLFLNYKVICLIGCYFDLMFVLFVIAVYHVCNIL
ncbi:hypothetical protein P8452_01903 [Trifolium repens]|nr:hypothetical protein P8452_01903 [Trifolium repens]